MSDWFRLLPLHLAVSDVVMLSRSCSLESTRYLLDYLSSFQNSKDTPLNLNSIITITKMKTPLSVSRLLTAFPVVVWADAIGFTIHYGMALW
jgi:hypothetical protein